MKNALIPNREFKLCSLLNLRFTYAATLTMMMLIACMPASAQEVPAKIRVKYYKETITNAWTYFVGVTAPIGTTFNAPYEDAGPLTCLWTNYVTAVGPTFWGVYGWDGWLNNEDHIVERKQITETEVELTRSAGGHEKYFEDGWKRRLDENINALVVEPDQAYPIGPFQTPISASSGDSWLDSIFAPWKQFAGLEEESLRESYWDQPNYYGELQPLTIYGPYNREKSFTKVETTIELLTGSSWRGTEKKFVLLSASTDIVSPGQCGLVSSSLTFSNISIPGFPDLNADYCTFELKQTNSSPDITLALTNVSWTNYQFTVTVVPHKTVSLIRAFHPKLLENASNTPTLELSNLQNGFDYGSRMLGIDNDDKIMNNHPSLTDTNILQSDDVPIYVEFKIANSAFFNVNGHPVFSGSYSNDIYFNVTTLTAINSLFDWNSPRINIKQVNSLAGEVEAAGRARLGVNPMNAVIQFSAGGGVYVHEWGHSCGNIIEVKNTLQALGLYLIQGRLKEH